MVDIARFCRLPVGLLTWQGPEPRWTLIVKGTFLLVDGAALFAEHQEPLALDIESSESDAGELERCSDFAPFKPAADILLTGLAYTSMPAQVLPFRLAVDGFEKRGYAMTTSPSRMLPLVQRYLRASPTGQGPPMRVGPRHAASRAAPGFVSHEGVLVRGAFRGFDFGAFNVAPRDQQIPRLREQATLVLEGLSPGGATQTTWLPGYRPRLFALRDAHAETAEEIGLVCDTLLIDSARRLLTLTWRVSLPVRKIWAFALALDGGGARNEWSLLRAHLAEAEWIRPMEPKDLGGVSALPKPQEEPRPPVDRPRSASTLVMPRDEESTGLINPAELARRAPVLPFAPSASMVTEEEIEELSDEEVEDATQTDDSALFGDGPKRAMTLPLVTSSEEVPVSLPPFWNRLLEDTRGTEAPPPSSRSLSELRQELQNSESWASRRSTEVTFVPGLESPSLAPVSPSLERPAAVSAPAVEQLPISLDAYAAVKVAFWSKADERAVIEDTLGEQGIDEDTWRAGEERLLEALAKEAREGRSDLARALRAAIRRAQQGAMDRRDESANSCAVRG